VAAIAKDALERAFDVPGRSLWIDARRRLMANKAAVAGITILALVTFAAVLAPLLSSYPYDATDYNLISCAPDWWPGALGCRAGGQHWFGTDAVGRDLFVRVLYGARVSLAVGLIATLVSLILGVGYGAVAGFVGRRQDELMMRFVDVLYSLPYIFLVIVLMVIFNRNFYLMFVAIGAVEWLTMARIVRGETLSIRNREFVEAARAAGVDPLATIGRHVIPNVVSPVVIYVTLTVPNVILAESFLSFLGLGIQEPWTSWGVLISQGADQMESAPWLLLFPSLFMAATLFSFNFIGDGLRDALDPKDR
jgi:oligopeptide transport system permease protein